jgi:catechol 2,3-dioxygenase-like lactoylglutathione lyase family enzyme
MLDYVIRYTSNVPRLVRFYREIARCEVRLERFGGRYVELDAGLATLAICDLDLRGELLPELEPEQAAASQSPNAVPPNADTPRPESDVFRRDAIQLSFRTTDVPAALDRGLDAGGTLVTPPSVKPWRCEVALIRDPDGLLIELCRRMSSDE